MEGHGNQAGGDCGREARKKRGWLTNTTGRKSKIAPRALRQCARVTYQRFCKSCRRLAWAISLSLISASTTRPRSFGIMAYGTAHTYPLVARRKGQSFRVHARQAWGYPSLELRAANSWPALTLDCDVPSAVVDALYWNHHGGDGPALPRVPAWSSSVEGQFSLPRKSWFLKRPVHRGESARAAPLRKLARIGEYYREVLKADRGYAGVLTHNPLEETHGPGTFQTHWGRTCGYSLDELAEPIPKGWRLARFTDPPSQGGTAALFRSLMKWAGSPANIGCEVLAVARATNDGLDVPLGDSEVAGLAKSVEGYRDGWIAKGRFYTEAEREAWGRSLGLARWQGAPCCRGKQGQVHPQGPLRRHERSGACPRLQGLTWFCSARHSQGRVRGVLRTTQIVPFQVLEPKIQ